MADTEAVHTDTHAHLGHVRDRIGQQGLEAMLQSFRKAQVPAPQPATHKSPGNAGPGAAAPFIVDIGTEPGDLASRIETFGSEGFVRFTAGLWPGSRSFDDSQRALRLLERDLDSGRCCALGECGLDYHHMEAPKKLQIRLFEAQARIAADRSLPLIVHTRDAFEDTCNVVKDIAGTVPVIIHCFGYGPDEATRLLEAGCLISFAGNITYKKAEALVEALKIVPLERLLVETDSPYMNPMPQRGRPSTPLDIARTVEFAAAVRREPVAALAEHLEKNALRIFGSAVLKP